MFPASGSLKAVFFDLGFTLINFKGDYQRVTNDSYRSLALALTRSRYPVDTAAFSERFTAVLSEYYHSRDADLIERPVELYLARVLNSFGHPDPSDEVTRSVLAEMYRTTESHWQLEPDARAVLEQLQHEGYRMGLISNAANADNANRLIDRFVLRPFFEFILISAVEKIRKPASRIYSRALSMMELPPSSAVMVGDTLTADIFGAQHAGLRAVWITTRADHPENTRVSSRVTPDAVIHRLSELPSVLQQLH